MDPELRSYNTLRGFLSGGEPDEPTYMECCAGLRVFGSPAGVRPLNAPDDALLPLDFDEIERELNVTATRRFRRGEIRRGPRVQRLDSWFYDAPTPQDAPLAAHIDALWDALRGGIDYLVALKQTRFVDVFLGYRTNIDMAGVDVPHTSLEMFTALEVPFSLSIIVI